MRVVATVGDAVAEIQHQRLDVGRDNRLVLDDQHVGRELGLDVALGPGDQLPHVFGRFVEDLGRLVDREAFERGQQEGLPVTRRNAQDALGNRRPRSPARVSSLAPVAPQIAWNSL